MSSLGNKLYRVKTASRGTVIKSEERQKCNLCQLARYLILCRSMPEDTAVDSVLKQQL